VYAPTQVVERVAAAPVVERLAAHAYATPTVASYAGQYAAPHLTAAPQVYNPVYGAEYGYGAYPYGGAYGGNYGDYYGNQYGAYSGYGAYGAGAYGYPTTAGAYVYP